MIMRVDIVHFYELRSNFGRALKNDDVYEEWKMIQQECLEISNSQVMLVCGGDCVVSVCM